jgi:peptidoglycan/xylan/chitin deacetylase (PgdA/CDA1 family)
MRLEQLDRHRRRNKYLPKNNNSAHFFLVVGGIALIVAVMCLGLFLANVLDNKASTVFRGVASEVLKNMSAQASPEGTGNGLPSRVEVPPETQPGAASTAVPNEAIGRTIIPGTQGAPRIYLTFDDGPSALSTPQILEVLDRYNVKATFFVLGTQAEARPEMIKAAAAAGHVVANHGYSHNYNAIYASVDAFMQEIKHTEDIITGILGEQPPRILRFPAGSAAAQLEKDPAMRESIKQTLAAEGWRYFDWNADMADSVSGPGPEPGVLANNLIASIEEKVSYGMTDIIVLAHDTNARTWTPTDLPAIIEHFQQKGYSFEVLTSGSPPYTYR